MVDAAPRGAQRRFDVCDLEIGELSDHLLRREPIGQEVEDVAHPDLHSADAWPTSALGGIAHDACHGVAYGCIVIPSPSNLHHFPPAPRGPARPLESGNGGDCAGSVTVEVDFVLEHVRRIVGIEVKAAATAKPDDFHALERLRAASGKAFACGIVLHDGERIQRVGDKLFAMPLHQLWA